MKLKRRKRIKPSEQSSGTTLLGCFAIALILCFVQISGNRMLIAGCLLAFLAFHFWSCFKDDALYTLLFFLPWSPLLRLYKGSVSAFTLAIFLTSLFYLKRNDFRLELYQILLTIFLMIVTLIAKCIQSNPIANDYLFFLAMIFLFPCVVKGACGKVSFERLTLFFACGIIFAALSARQIAAYPNISQYIKVDSYLTITRLSGYYWDPNFYSAHITACLAGIQIIMSRGRQRLSIFVWAALFIALVYCGLLSASKSFVLVFACLCLVWLPIILENGKINDKVAYILGFLCAGAVFLSSSAVQDLMRVFETRFSYASNISQLTTGRTDLWLKYLREFADNGLLTLLGEGYTSSVTLDNVASHNTVIQGVYQLGVIGFPILCAWMGFVLKRAGKGQFRHCGLKYIILMCIGVVLPWMALDILFFDEFFLLPIYAVIGIVYSVHGEKSPVYPT